MLKLLSLIKNNWKSYFLIGITPIILFIGVKYYLLSYDYDSIKENYDKLLIDYQILHQNYDELQTAFDMKRVETLSVQQLLHETQENLNKRTQDLLEIDSIMSLKEDTMDIANSTPKTSDKKEEEYDHITILQNRAGIDFMHRQFDTLK